MSLNILCSYSLKRHIEDLLLNSLETILHAIKSISPNLVVSIIAVIIAILLPFVVERLKLPNLEIYPQREDVRKESDHWIYHLVVKNKKRKHLGSLVQRSTATQCVAGIEFIDKVSGKSIHQIIGKWATQPNPISFPWVVWTPDKPQGVPLLDATKVPVAQTTDIGFKERPLDIVIKYRGEKSCYAFDPWKFLQWKEDPNCKIDTDECILKVEIRADNMPLPIVKKFILLNKGTELEDVLIIPFTKKHDEAN